MNDYNKMSKKELFNICNNLCIKKYKSKTKKDLINLIEKYIEVNNIVNFLNNYENIENSFDIKKEILLYRLSYKNYYNEILKLDNIKDVFIFCKIENISTKLLLKLSRKYIETKWYNNIKDTMIVLLTKNNKILDIIKPELISKVIIISYTLNYDNINNLGELNIYKIDDVLKFNNKLSNLQKYKIDEYYL